MIMIHIQVYHESLVLFLMHWSNKNEQGFLVFCLQLEPSSHFVLGKILNLDNNWMYKKLLVQQMNCS